MNSCVCQVLQKVFFGPGFLSLDDIVLGRSLCSLSPARPGAERCYSLGSFGQAKGLVAAGLSLHCNAKSSYPLSLINGVVDSDIHHNWCESDTVLLKSRHYPGNDIVRLDTSGGVNRIHHNILLKGCHRGMAFHGKGGETHVYENEIASDQGYVNGYTINCTGNMKIYRNRIKSCSRGMHVTASNIEIYDNWLDLHQHQVFDDRPQGSTNYRHYNTENHGIKLESPGTNVKIHGNFVRSTQPQPDPGAKQRFSNALSATGARIEERSGMKGDRDHYAPATPLNFHSTKNSDVEAIRAAGAFRGRLHIHDNVFKSNDIFVNGREWSSGIRLEKNRFVLLPGATSNHRAVNGGAAAGALRSGGNTFEGQSP